MTLATTHANALVIGESGVLLRGPSGSGKSALTLMLIERARARGLFSRIIGDDRVALENYNGRLIALPHPAIAGMIEIRGLGVRQAHYESGGVIRFVVDLASHDTPPPPRLPTSADEMTTVLEIALPRLGLSYWDACAVDKILHFYHCLTST